MTLAHVDRLLAAFAVLYQRSMANEGLPLLFVAIDTMAQISSLGQGRMGERFKGFCNKYMDLHGLKVDAHDLWGSRCGILHAWTAESDESKNGRAVELYYYWGSAKREVLASALAAEQKNAKPVSIEHLALSVRDAADRFFSDVKSRPSLAAHAGVLKQKILESILVKNGEVIGQKKPTRKRAPKGR